jgi:predicted nucleic acid-binding protein
MLIDSQIWIYYLNENAQEHESVTNWLEGNDDGALFIEEIGLSIIIPIEVAHHLFAIKNIDKDSIMDFMNSIIGAKNIHIFSFQEIDLMETLVQLKKVRMTGIGGRDMMILVTMEKNGIDTLVTHDKNLLAQSKYKRVDPVMNPPLVLQVGEKYIAH